MKNQLNKILVTKDTSIKETMRTIDQGRLGIAFVIDKNKRILGVVSDGDIRRAILEGINIEKPIEEIMNKDPIILKDKRVKKDMLKLNTNPVTKERFPLGGSLQIPVLDEKRNIKDLIFLYPNEKYTSFLQSNYLGTKERNIKKVLIIGGAGYLGSVLCRKLLKKEYRVRVLDNLTYGDEGIKALYKNPSFELFKGDIRNISDVIEAIKEVDAVIHLAAIVGDSACSIDARKTIEINYLATKSIAETCKFNQINKFLFASTCSVYGENKDIKERLTENSALNPLSLYAETKLKSETGILGLSDENFFPTIFRFSTFYGVSPRMRFDLVINLLTAQTTINKKITIFGGRQWRPNLDVSDAANACVKWLESPIEKSGGNIFNVGTNNQNYQIIQIGKLIKELIPETKIKIERGKIDLRNYNVSFDKISDVLSFKPRHTMKEAIVKIKKLIENKKIKDFSNPKYNNYRFLSNYPKKL